MNDHVHPMFRKTLDELSAPSFDEWDDDLMQDLFGKRIAGPAADLLQAYAQIAKVADSFGFVSAEAKAKALDFILPKILAFREGAKDQWRDSQ